MKKSTLETFSEDIQWEKVIAFFHKAGCPRCTQMSPVMEELEKTHSNVTFIEYLCKAQDDVNRNLPIKIFPWVFCYSKGVLIGGNENIMPLEMYPILFLSTNEKKIMSFDFDQMALKAEEDSRSLRATALIFKDSILKTAVASTVASTEDFPLTPPSSPIDTEPCESCQ